MGEEIEYIDHDGEIVAIDARKRTVTVLLDETEECGGCPAGKLCHNFSPDSNRMVVGVARPEEFRVGDTVTVRGSERLHSKAVVLINVIPTAAIIVVLIGIYLLTGSQVAAGLCALGAMAVFFTGIYLIRHRLAREFVFTVIKKEKEKET